jgi:Bifunctional DNA primase/polymerase, N-terminal
MSVLDEALALATTGLRVFPLNGKKRPTIPSSESGHGGFYAASNDPEVVWRHWRYFWGPLVAYATGEPNGIDVLDIDEDRGGESFLVENWHRLPRTFMYRTGGDGGWHLQFIHRPGQRSVPIGRIAAGVEVKSTGGYAVAWFAHGAFVLDNSPLAPWPEWLLDLAKPPPLPPMPARSHNRELRISPSRRLAGVIARIENAGIGERHSLIHWGGRIIGLMAAGREIENLHAAIEEIALAGIRAGKDPKEARRTAFDGARAGLRHA